MNLDSVGSIIWQKSLGGTTYDIAYSIQQTNDNGFIISGESNSIDGDVSNNHGNIDYWILKLDSIGTIQWQNSYGGTLGESSRYITQTNDSGYLAFGQALSGNGDVSGTNGGGDYWLVKLSQTGIFEWQKCLGGNSNDFGYSCIQTIDGGYLAVGSSESNNGDVTGNHGMADFWIVKLSSLGTSLFELADEKLIEVYPNPTNSILNLISKEEILGSKYIICDVIGKIILEGTIESSKMQIDLNFLSIGTYFLSLKANMNYSVKLYKE